MIEVLTPDNWGEHGGEPSAVLFWCTETKRALTIHEAIGTTPERSPKLNHIGISGGKDSDALLAWALFESGYEHSTLVVSFCDTENEDELTYAQIEVLRVIAAKYGVRILTVRPGKGFMALVRHKGMFPSRKRRFCTQFLKMEPTRLFCHALTDAGYDVLLHSGVRADESDDRAKLPDREFDGYFGMLIYRPLLTRTISDVVAMHEKYEIPFNKLYRLGARRVGCFPCINSVKREMRLVAELRPEKIDAIEAEEKAMTQSPERKTRVGTFFHRNTVPLRFRSLEYVTKDGRRIKVATIRDIVAWSQTGKRARGKWNDQPALDGFKEDDAGVCSLTYGACE